MRFDFLALAFCIAACGTATSQTSVETRAPETFATQAVPGAGAQLFRYALEDWLDGNDLLALESLANLARQDNRAAQIFLARIAEDAKLHTHATSELPRRERVELLRHPGGLSGQSWIAVAARNVPLAKAFQDATRIESRSAGARALFKLGETAEAARLLRPMILNGQAAEVLDILATTENLPQSITPFQAIARNWARSPYPRYTGSARPAALMDLDSAPYGFSVSDLMTFQLISLGELLVEPRTRADAIHYAANVEAWTPLRALCKKYCPSSVVSCTAVGASALWSAPVLPFASPVESLLPTARYWSSRRIEADVLRRLMDLSRTSDYFGGIDKCFAPTFGRLQRRDF